MTSEKGKNQLKTAKSDLQLAIQAFSQTAGLARLPLAAMRRQVAEQGGHVVKAGAVNQVAATCLGAHQARM